MSIIDLNSQQEPDYFSSQVAFAKRFYRHGMGIRGDRGYRVISGGMETCLPGYRVDREDFPYWAIEFVSSGRGTLNLDGKEFSLRPGTVFAYSPGVPHQITADAVYPLKKYFVDFLPAKKRPESFAVLANLLAGRVLHSHSAEALRRSYDDLLEFGPRDSVESDRICSRLLGLLLWKIGDNSAESELAESPAYRAYRRSLDIIDQRFLDLVTVAEAAEAANMDVSYLCRLFKKFSDETPYKRLSRLRMNYAAGLLLREGYSVASTASELGYADAFTFSKRFKAVMGQSPQDLRKSIQSY